MKERRGGDGGGLLRLSELKIKLDSLRYFKFFVGIKLDVISVFNGSNDLIFLFQQ